MRLPQCRARAAGKSGLDCTRVVDTLLLARQKFPGAPASLDALCKRFAIDNSARNMHGALLDAELLADGLSGADRRPPGRPGAGGVTLAAAQTLSVAGERQLRPPRPHAASEAELAAHAELLKQITGPIWNA